MENQHQLSEEDFRKNKWQKVAKPLIWVGIISIIMLFAGLTSAVIVRKGDGNWLQYEMPSMFLWSTLTIVLSSLALYYAYLSAKKNNSKGIKLGLILTMLLSIAFIFMQLEGYNQLMVQEVFFTGKNHNASGSFLYVISFLHLLHLVGGIIALIVVLFNAFKERYNSKNLLGLQVFSTYWHFLGGLWIYLYLFFRLII
tara:strand:- start:24497 stop:25090 length:594 start_codon:yes stop_codon:yes gene_type:complete